MIKCIWSLTVYNLDTHNITQGMQCENDIRPATVYAVLSLWTLLLLLKPQTKEKLEANQTKPKEQGAPNPTLMNYFHPLSKLMTVTTCSFKFLH